MNIHFSSSAVSAMVTSAVITLVLPFVLLVYYRFKKNANLSRFFIGIGIYIGAGLLLSTMVSAGIAFIFKNFGHAFYTTPWIYALFTTLIPAILIQIASYLVMKYFIKNNQTPANALMLGTGIGAFSSLVTASIMISNAILAFYVNSVGITAYLEKLKLASSAVCQQKEAILSLSTRNGAEYFNVGANMFLLLMFQIAITLFIYYCIQKKELARLFPITIVLYTLFMFPWNLTQAQILQDQPITLGSNGVLLFEGILLACTIYFVRKIHHHIQ